MRILITITAICLVASCKKAAPEPLAEIPVSKKIEFHIHADPGYAAPYYTDAMAEVKMAIYRINYKNGDSEKVWDTTFSNRAVHTFPVSPEKHIIEKMVPALESRDKLQANYNIIYRHKGYTTQQASAEECIPGQLFLSLDVGI
jgi:hypothetical protein